LFIVFAPVRFFNPIFFLRLRDTGHIVLLAAGREADLGGAYFDSICPFPALISPAKKKATL
jgi:hypothetical protein